MSAQKSSSLGTLGADAAARWLIALGLAPVPRWFVEIAIGRDEPRFSLAIYAEEWGYSFHHAGRASWIRVTDIAFVHGRDDFALLTDTGELDTIGGLIPRLEVEHDIKLPRSGAEIRTNLEGATDAIRAWLVKPGSRLRRTREL
jgi:hypothetical protein